MEAHHMMRLLQEQAVDIVDYSRKSHTAIVRFFWLSFSEQTTKVCGKSPENISGIG